MNHFLSARMLKSPVRSLIACLLGASVAFSAAVGDWQTTTLKNASIFYTLDYSNGAFVAADDSGRIYRSTDGANSWKLDTAIKGAEFLYSTHSANAMLFSDGNYGGSAYVSWDTGKVWNNISLTSKGITLGGLAYGSAGYVAVGTWSSSYGMILHSTDAKKWDSVFYGKDPSAGNVGMVLNNVAYVNGMYVVMGSNGSNGRIYTSTNGTAWTERAFPKGLIYPIGVAYGHGVFVMVDVSSNKIFTSQDGTTWSTNTDTVQSYLNAITFAKDTFYVVGPAGLLKKSVDGQKWVTENTGTSSELFGISYGKGVLALSGEGGVLLRKTIAMLPTVVTGSASAVTSATVTLSGIVNANNDSTVDSIQYGTTTAYGTTVVASPASLKGLTATPIAANLSGLQPGTTYHYRVKAQNGIGESFGLDSTFTTPKLSQSLSVTAAGGGTYGDTVTLMATASSKLSVTWTSLDTNCIRIIGSKAVLRKAGKAVVIASQSGNAIYDSAHSLADTIVIARRLLSLSGVVVSDKVYDGTVAATVSGGAFDSVLAGDSVSLVLGTASFQTKDAEADKNVILTGSRLAGRDLANYTLASSSGSGVATDQVLHASITARPLEVRAVNAMKEEGQADPELAYGSVSLLFKDSLTGALVRDPGESVGIYAIRQGSLSAGSNYQILFDTALFTITAKKPVTGIEGRSRLHAGPDTLGILASSNLPLAANGRSRAELGLTVGGDVGTLQSLTFALPVPGEISVDIFDLLGTPVVSWSSSIDSSVLGASGGVVTVAWNLRAADGRAVPAGVYLWKVKVSTVDGQVLEAVKKMGVR